MDANFNIFGHGLLHSPAGVLVIEPHRRVQIGKAHDVVRPRSGALGVSVKIIHSAFIPKSAGPESGIELPRIRGPW